MTQDHEVEVLDAPDDQSLENLAREIESWRSNMKIRKQVFAEASERLQARVRAHRTAAK